MLIKGIFFLLLSSSCIFGQQLFGQTGSIKGTVKEFGSAETLPGANVIIEGTTIGVSTDFDGQFELKNIKPGVYTLKVSFISYNEKVISGIEVLAGEEKFIEVELDDAALTITSVTIEGRLRRDRENVILLEQRKATNITQSIGAQELSRKGVGDVAAAVTWSMLGNLLGIGFAAVSDIWINGYPPAVALVGEFLPSAGPNLIFAAILVPILVGAYAAVQKQTGR